MGVEVNALEAGLFIRKLVDFDSNWKKKKKKPTYTMHLTNRRLSLRCVGSLTIVVFFPSPYLLPSGFSRARPS